MGVNDDLSVLKSEVNQSLRIVLLDRSVVEEYLRYMFYETPLD